MPRWMHSLDEIAAPRAFLAALAYAFTQPQDARVRRTGTLTILEASLGARAEWAMLALFVLLSSLTVSAPVAFRRGRSAASRRSLAITRRWLGDNAP